MDDPNATNGVRSHRWGIYYLGISVMRTLLFLGAVLDLPLFSLLPATVAVGLVLAAFWLVTLSHFFVK